MKKEGIGTALKHAFSWHWNLLALGVATVFAFLSREPVTWLPIVAALEAAYLGFIGLQPRFQNVLRGERLSKNAAPQAAASQRRFEQIASFLTEDDLARFQRLQTRCAALLELRRHMDDEQTDDRPQSFRGESLDRMLWLFLKLLHQRSGLQRFLTSTRRDEIETDFAAAESQLAAAQERDAAAGGLESRLTTAVRDRVRTIGERLQNYDKARESLELVGAEIEKTEQQIKHLCEVGMTMRDSADLSAQIDGISESLRSSEKAFAHVSMSTYLNDEEAPPLLSGASSQPPPIQKRASVSQ